MKHDNQYKLKHTQPQHTLSAHANSLPLAAARLHAHTHTINTKELTKLPQTPTLCGPLGTLFAYTSSCRGSSRCLGSLWGSPLQRRVLWDGRLHSVDEQPVGHDTHLHRRPRQGGIVHQLYVYVCVRGCRC